VTYKQRSSQPVAEGGIGASTLTGVITASGTGALTAAAVTQYGVLVGDASNAVTSTAVGSATQVLTSNGAGVAPTFQAGGGGSSGAWEYVSTTTISSDATINFTSLSGSDYMFVLYNVIPENDALLTIRVTDDGGSTWEAVDYQYVIIYSDIALANTTNTSAAEILINEENVGQGSGQYGVTGTINAFNLNEASYPASFTWRCIQNDDSGDLNLVSGCGISADDGAGGETLDVDGIQFYFDSGDLVSGTIYLYKLVTA
jgi:hypothetical protein